MQKYKKMFVEEAREHLGLAARQLVALEKAPGELERVHELFRNAHSIKGMAASLGYEEIANLSHALEDLLDLVRTGERVLGPAQIDLFLRAVDLLERMVTQVEADAPAEDPAPLLSEIQALLTSGPDAAAAAPAEGGAPAAASAAAPATAGGRLAPPDAGAAPGGRLRVSFRVAADSVSPGARGFLAVSVLEKLGRVRRLRPEIEVIKSGRYGRIVDAELESDQDAPVVAEKLAALTEILDVRVAAADQEPAAAAARPGPASAPAVPSGGAPAGQPATVRVRVESLDRFVDAVGELFLSKAELREIARDLDSEALLQGLSRLEGSLEELKRQAMSIRLTPLERVLGTLPRLVRDLSRAQGKEVELEIRGADLELDRAVVDALSRPLIHLIRNAIDHGIESPDRRAAAGKPPQGRLLVEAYREKEIAVIHVEDDGHGVDLEAVKAAAVGKKLADPAELQGLDEQGVLSLLFLPGMSTAAEVSEISGRGVGLDAVKSTVQGLGGIVLARTRAGNGTQFTLRIPFSAAILRTLIVRVGEDVFAVPIPKLHCALEIEPRDLLEGGRGNGAARFCRFEGSLVPTRSLGDLLGIESAAPADPEAARAVIVADTRRGRRALLVDALVGEEEVFVKPLGRPLSALECLSGITVLGNGRPVFVLDPYGLEAPMPADPREAARAGGGTP